MKSKMFLISVLTASAQLLFFANHAMAEKGKVKEKAPQHHAAKKAEPVEDEDDGADDQHQSNQGQHGHDQKGHQENNQSGEHED